MNKIEVKNINPDTTKTPHQSNRKVYVKVENKESGLNGPYHVPVTEIIDGKVHITPSQKQLMEIMIYKNSGGGYSNATIEENTIRELIVEIPELKDSPEKIINGDFDLTFWEIITLLSQKE